MTGNTACRQIRAGATIEHPEAEPAALRLVLQEEACLELSAGVNRSSQSIPHLGVPVALMLAVMIC